MGTGFVVGREPPIGDLPDLVQGFEEVRVEDLLAVRPVESLDVGVLIWLAGLDVEDGDVVLPAPVDEQLGKELRAVVAANGIGQPTPAAQLFERPLGIEVSMTISSPSRTPSSRTLNVRKRRP
jgi:hypothetical protein